MNPLDDVIRQAHRENADVIVNDPHGNPQAILMTPTRYQMLVHQQVASTTPQKGKPTRKERKIRAALRAKPRGRKRR